MKNKIETMIKNMDLVFCSSEKMGDSANKGDTNISELITTTKTLETDFNQFSDTIKKVNRHS
ncbi:hypothetical protein ACDX78_08385 [Virgibacillus oceani]